MAQTNSGTGYQQGTTAAPQKARALLSVVSPQVRGFVDKAFLTIGSGNAAVTYAALQAGVPGNAITVAHVVAGVSTPLSISVIGTAITVNVATNGSSVAISTAAQVAAAIAASAPAAALVTAVAGGTGAGVVGAQAATALSGGQPVNVGGASNAPAPKQPTVHNRYGGQSTGSAPSGPPQVQQISAGNLRTGY